MAAFSEIQHNRLKGEKPFQDFCLKLIRRFWNDEYATLHGRLGQKQHGADITGCDYRNGHQNSAVQCKGSETNDPRRLTEKELVDEVEKAKDFVPALDLLIIAYMGDRDAKLQRKAKELDSANRESGLFKVVLWSWDDILERVESFPDLWSQLLVQKDVGFVNAVDPKRPTADKAAALELIQSTYQVVQSLAEPTSESSSFDIAANAKIDAYRDQINLGNGVAVVEPLRSLIEELSAETNSHTRFRAYANLGAALVQSSEIEQATIAFDKAAETEVGTADSDAYAARAALHRCQFEAAFEHAKTALSLSPDHLLAATILVESAPPETPTSHLEEKLGSIAHEIDVGWAISRRYCQEKLHDSSLRAARNIEDNAGNWARAFAIAEAIMSRFEGNFDELTAGPLDNEERALLSEAVELMRAGWKIARSRNDRENWAYTLTNLSAALRLAGDQVGAIELALEAHALAPENSALIEPAALAYLQKGDQENAARLAARIVKDNTPESSLLAANVYRWVGDFLLAEKWAQNAFDLSADCELKCRAADVLIAAILNNNGAEAAQALVEGLRSEIPNCITLETRAAELARRMGDESALNDARQRLAAFEVSDLTLHDRFELSGAYADDGSWSDAARLLAGMHSLDRPSAVLHRRLFALYRADERKDARALFESLKATALNDVDVLRLGAAIYERSGMIPEALEQLRKAGDIEPGDLRSHLDWARLSIRNDDERSVKNWIKKVDLEFSGEPEDLLELAQLLDKFGRRTDALGLGYRTLRANWGRNEHLHLMYISLFLLRGGRREGALHPERVGKDTVVFLVNEHGEKTHFRIEAVSEASENVLPLEHPFARTLIGCETGEKRVAPQQLGQAVEWKILEIKHKYIDLFHTVMQTHSTLFPESHAMGSVRIDTQSLDGFEPIFEQVRQRARQVEEVLQIYQQSIIPIDVVAKVVGSDPLEVLVGMRQEADVRIDTCIGQGDERDRALSQISDVREIIVDPLTLALWDEVGFCPILDTLENFEVFVVQSTIDAIATRSELARQDLANRGGALYAKGENVGVIEYSMEQRRAIVDKWEKLEKWCRASCVVLPTEVFPDHEGRDIRDILSDASVDTLATALATELSFLCEDRRLRSLAQSLGVRRSAWSQALFLSLLTENRISQSDYGRLIAQLQRSRCGFVSVRSHDLVERITSSDFEDFDTLVGALTHNKVNSNTMVIVMVDTIVEILQSPKLSTIGYGFASRLLDAVLVRPPAGLKIFELVATQVYRSVLRLDSPVEAAALGWAKYVETYVKGHFLTEALSESRAT